MNKINISYLDFILDVGTLVKRIKDSQNKYDFIYAIPRGGVPAGLLLSEKLMIPMTETLKNNVLIVDDLIDSGKTLEDTKEAFFKAMKEQGNSEMNYDIAVLYRKPHSPDTADFVARELDGWIQLPYEETEKDEEAIIIRLLETLGENPNREGLKDTPKRVIKFYKEFLQENKYNFTTFDSEGYDEMIVQKDIPFFSLCEHHLAPFFGHATVAYVPNGKIVGLSKLTRTVEHFARKLQNQERITNQIAEKLEQELNPMGVAVVLKARHFCMEMRGVRTHDVHTITSKVSGIFRTKPEARAEFMDLMK